MTKKYKCPGCGKMVRLGSHFCSGEQEAQLDDPFPTHTQSPKYQTLKKVTIILVASALVLALLLSTLGFFAYILIGVIAIIVLAMFLLQGGVSGAGLRIGDNEYDILLRLLNRDKGAAERLIEAEMNRYPEFSRKECIRRVRDKLEYDRSR